MGAFLLSPHIVDAILLILGLEVAVLTLLRPGISLERRLGSLVIAALPGALLLLALRAVLSGAGWPWVALFLAASFPAHLADLWRRPPR
jgi:hypothetical protein